MTDPLSREPDSPMKVSLCRSCQARVIWVETQNGRMMPVDAEPTIEGNIDLVVGGESILPDRPPRLHKETDPPLAFYRGHHPPLKRYVSHFATCPNADQFRTKANVTPSS